MATTEMNCLASGGGTGFIEAENPIPNSGGTAHVYTHECTNASGYALVSGSNTLFLEFALEDGVLTKNYVDTSYANTSVSYNNGTLTISISNSWWGGEFYATGW